MAASCWEVASPTAAAMRASVALPAAGAMAASVALRGLYCRWQHAGKQHLSVSILPWTGTRCYTQSQSATCSSQVLDGWHAPQLLGRLL